MNIIVHPTVDQLATWLDEQLCGWEPALLELHRRTRYRGALRLLQDEAASLIEGTAAGLNLTYWPSAKLQSMTGTLGTDFPMRVIPDVAVFGLWRFASRVELDNAVQHHASALLRSSLEDFVSRYGFQLVPISGGLLRICGWNRRGQMQLTPTMEGLRSFRVPRCEVTLSRIGRHLARKTVPKVRRPDRPSAQRLRTLDNELSPTPDVGFQPTEMVN